jgi:hypothetical protein
LGAVRDAKGKSVAEVFVTLDPGAKAEVSRHDEAPTLQGLVSEVGCNGFETIDPQGLGYEGVG